MYGIHWRGEILLNPWIAKVGIHGDSNKVGSKLTPQERSIFPRNINKF